MIPEHNQPPEAMIPEHNQPPEAMIPQHNQPPEAMIPQHNQPPEAMIPEHNQPPVVGSQFNPTWKRGADSCRVAGSGASCTKHPHKPWRVLPSVCPSRAARGKKLRKSG